MKSFGDMMMPDPRYIMREDSLLSQDYIQPYGDRIQPSSESERKRMAMKLLGVWEEFKNDGKEDDSSSTSEK